MTTLKILKHNLHGFNEYTWYLNHTAILIITAISIAFIIFWTFVSHRSLVHHYMSLAFPTDCKLWAKSILVSALVGTAIYTCIAFVLNIGGIFMPVNKSATKATPHQTLVTAIQMQKRMPKLRAEYHLNKREYTSTAHPTKLEKQMEPTYRRTLAKHISYNKHYVNFAKHLKMKWYYYI